MLSYNKIYNLDIFDFLRKIDDESIDLAIIDPPYNLKVAQWDSFKSENDFLDFSYAWMDAMLSKIKKTGSFYIFNTAYNSALFLNYLKGKANFINWITWYKKDGFSNCRKKYNNATEVILFYSKGRDYTFNYNDIRVPYESVKRMEHASQKGILKNGKRWFPHPDGKLCTDVWEISSQRHKEKVNGKIQKLSHPTIKPYSMIERIVKASSNENDIVLDLFAGSGIGLKVCLNLNRLYLGTDINY
ncbi:site-specific DNA-methyltransferase [Campylobacter lari]|nr:site-specific DNA-methyltransferase [Campylobacter lari]EBF6064484.1 site-specific DNA-methyltransferase [Campylobacter lari]EEC4842024.1 site-specific DNA-methyltransferase [Campylobacter lari]MCH3717562.1 site-specific DNA-methyltransferase [Campylobacter lari]HEA6928497.1 site-specific DNA-methyltransferase [Campylobacter lari]